MFSKCAVKFQCPTFKETSLNFGGSSSKIYLHISQQPKHTNLLVPLNAWKWLCLFSFWNLKKKIMWLLSGLARTWSLVLLIFLVRTKKVNDWFSPGSLSAHTGIFNTKPKQNDTDKVAPWLDSFYCFFESQGPLFRRSWYASMVCTKIRMASFTLVQMNRTNRTITP